MHVRATEGETNLVLPHKSPIFSPKGTRRGRTYLASPKECAYAQHVPFGEEGEQTQSGNDLCGTVHVASPSLTFGEKIGRAHLAPSVTGEWRPLRLHVRARPLRGRRCYKSPICTQPLLNFSLALVVKLVNTTVLGTVAFRVCRFDSGRGQNTL